MTTATLISNFLPLDGVGRMIVGLIGKPNTGKSTFFTAATQTDVQIASYPFTTVNPNVGMTYVSSKCVCRELGVKDDPVNSMCVDGVRYIPLKIVDVAGLIPGASKGLGLGNRFLDDVRRADVIIHVVDVSGSTDSEGKPVEQGSHDPMEDVEFVEREYELWMRGIIEKDWNRLTKLTDVRRVVDELERRMSGLGITDRDILVAMEKTGLSREKPVFWGSDALDVFVHELRKISKPIIVAANKVDVPLAKENVERMRASGVDLVPVSALSELILRRAAGEGIIRYRPGDPDFEIVDEERLSHERKRALEIIRERVMEVYGGTGVQQILNRAVFELLDTIVVYPVEDENKYTDKDGRVLPDAYLVRRGTTAKELAYIVHTELGEGFLYAVDAKRKVKVGADYRLRHNDVIKVVAVRRR